MRSWRHFPDVAGTYTPFVAGIADREWRWGLMGAIWIFALTGLVIKLAFPRRLERVSLLAYLGLGWIVLAALHPILDGVTAPAVLLLIIGGILYTIDVAFHLSEGLRFHNTIWHAVVVVAAGFHYCAIALASDA